MFARRLLATSLCLAALAAAAPASARTVHRCVRDGSVSVSTAPEPGSKCTPVTLDDDAAETPNPWGAVGVKQGTLYRRMQDGRAVYGTRKLPGAVEVQSFTVKTPEPPALPEVTAALGAVRLDLYAKQFRASARTAGVDEALLRSIAHVESGFDRLALSEKGAQGLMQIMPATGAMYGLQDPYAADQSIDAGARYLRDLIRRYDGQIMLAAAAYNAGPGAVARFGGVPPFPETQHYVAKVMSLHARYLAAGQAAERTPAAP